MHRAKINKRSTIKKLINSPIILWLSILLAVAPSTPSFKFLIADSMTFHMLGQIPLLILAGYLIGRHFNSHCNLHLNPKSLYIVLSCWLWFMFASLFWMLPISLDKALLDYGWDFFKIISLMLSGILLTFALSDSKIPCASVMEAGTPERFISFIAIFLSPVT